MFFGSSGSLQDAVAQLDKNMTTCILDFKRINEIDSSGAYALRQIKLILAKENKNLLISHLCTEAPYWVFLHEMGVLALIGYERIYPYTDEALEWAEDQLLTAERKNLQESAEVNLRQLSFFANFSNDEFSLIFSCFQPVVLKEGDIIIHEGDTSRDLYFLTQGKVTVYTQISGKKAKKRIVTFGPGVLIRSIASVDKYLSSLNASVRDPLHLKPKIPELLPSQE